MDVITVIERSGGLATRADLIRATSRADVDRAVARGSLRRVGHGRYALPGVEQAAAAAHRLNGHLSLTSAAVHHGWEVKTVPPLPHVVFPRKRNVPRLGRREVVVHRADLGPDDVAGIATSRELTLLQCLRSLPDDEALAIADSALRHGEISTLRRVHGVRSRGGERQGTTHRGTGRCARREPLRVRHARHLPPGARPVRHPAAGPVGDHFWACPDLVDRKHRIVIECDSWQWHGDRKGFLKDVRRYTLLSADGWTVLRFTWDDVMLRPAWVRDVLSRAVGVDARTEVHRCVACGRVNRPASATSVRAPTADRGCRAGAGGSTVDRPGGAMSQPTPEPVPPAVRAQILATEHWGLLAVRSQTWSEVIGRITSQLMFTSATLLFLALAGQALSYSPTFRLLAIALGLTLLIAGTLTSFRVHNASQEDYMFIKGMNRLRAAYLDIDPTLAPYFITGLTDDDDGIGQTYTMGATRRSASQVLSSSGMFIIVVNTLVAAGVAAFVLWPAGGWVAAVGAVVVGAAHFAVWIWLGWRAWQVNIDPAHVRFPAQAPGSEQVS